MSIISYDFLKLIHDKHNLFKLIPYIKNRDDRMCFERIFAVLVYVTKLTNRLSTDNISVFGCIHTFCRWGYTYDHYINNYTGTPRETLNMKKIVKVWSGR